MDSAIDDYFSTSSIDNPPQEPGEASQEELFDEDGHDGEVEEFLDTQVPESFEVRLTLMLRATRGNKNPITLPVAAGKIPSEMIEQLLDKHMGSERFRKILRSIVGEPFKGSDETTTTSSPDSRN